jgi:hypothetical protein
MDRVAHYTGTSPEMLCQYHHDICIHRWGWDIELLPDGSTRAYGPQGQVLRSHAPPATQAA